MKSRIEDRGTQSARMCEVCDRPAVTYDAQDVTAMPKHGSAKHANVITWEELDALRAPLLRRGGRG